MSRSPHSQAYASIVGMAFDLDRYGIAFERQYGYPIARDGALTTAFTQILSGLMVLTLGDLGNYDRLHLQTIIRDVGHSHGIIIK